MVDGETRCRENRINEWSKCITMLGRRFTYLGDAMQIPYRNVSKSNRTSSPSPYPEDCLAPSKAIIKMIFKQGDKVRHSFPDHGICTIVSITSELLKVTGTRYSRIHLLDEKGNRFSCDDQFVRLVDPSVEQREAIAVLGEDYFA